MYYVTMTHDNVEEVISVHLKDDELKIKDYLADKFGELNSTIADSGTIECVPWNDKDVLLKIVKY